MNKWVLGARPKTLAAAIVPVAVGTRLAVNDGAFVWWAALLALIVALGLQVGVNYANDYSDGKRGTDAIRVGPTRMVASGLASLVAVKRAALIALSVAAVAGLVLCLLTQPWLLIVGAAAIAAAWYYTGGKRPYGYSGFGEFFVFVFFGPVAVLGTQYVQSGQITGAGVFASLSIGLLAVALLVVNNLRDSPNDAKAGKKTLAVRMGDLATRRFYLVCIGLPFLLNFATLKYHPGAVVAFLAAVLIPSVARPVQKRVTGSDLVPVLVKTARLQLVFGLLLAFGLGF